MLRITIGPVRSPLPDRVVRNGREYVRRPAYTKEGYGISRRGRTVTQWHDAQTGEPVERLPRERRA